jgi:uncharacterized repeat protein (TIGR01451 family)/fimbrial isopeptide formation D2 family protein
MAMTLVAALVIPLTASAVTSATHEIAANWVGNPAAAPFGSAIISEWHINTNDANVPPANDPVSNVRLTLTATNGAFASLPAVCKTRNVTPVSVISANGTQLLCNLGTINEGTATVLQAPVRPNGAIGSVLSLSGAVTSDSAAAPTSPSAPPGLPITGSHGMDLVLSAPNQNYQQTTIVSRSGGNRPSVVVDYGVAMTVGSVPGPSTYTFTVDIAVSVAGQLPGLQWEHCAPVDNSAQATGIPYSDPSFANRTNAPTCSISGSGTHYTITLSGLDYTLQHVPTVDSLGTAIPSTTNFIAAGQLLFSYTTPITASTGVTFGATPSPFTFIDSVTQPETNTSNDASGTSLVLPGVFSMIWMGSPTAGRSPWDANLWAAPGAAQNQTFPWPAAGSSTNPGPYFLRDQPGGGQADSVTWSTYSGAGGTDMAGSCVMLQNPAAFTLRWADFLAADGASYSNITTAHLWYRTDTLNTKTETCGEPVGVAGSPWISAPLPAGCATQTASISPAYSDDQCIVSLPAGVTAVKMTWNPAVDRQFHHFLRVWGYVPVNAAIGAESWVVGTFNAPYNTATVFPGYPTLNNYINISTSPTVIANIPGSTYGPNTNGIRDAMRIQGPNGAITKTTPSGTAAPGESVTYNLTAESDLAVANPPSQTFTVTDTLPTGMSYVVGSGTPTPSLSVNGSGQQVLSYTFTNVPANTPQPITYQALVAANGTVTPGTVLTNTAQIDVPGDNRPAAAKQASASVTVPNNGATTLGKVVESSVLSFYGDSSAWDLTINSVDPTSNPFTDTIDILPNVADGRGTSIDGTYSITGVTAPAGSTVYYSSAPIASLSDDPRTASNGGTPGSIAGNTVGWSTTAVAHPTAIRVIAPALAPGALQTIRIAFTIPAATSCTAPLATDNKPGQKMVNSAGTITGHTALPMRSSGTGTIGTCYALGITKYVLVHGGDPANPADWHDANTASDYQQYTVGETIPYKIVATNLGPGTLTNVTVTDALAPTCNFTITTLAAGASQTQVCAMTAATAGTTVNIASASVSPLTGPQLTPSDPAGVIIAPPPPQISITKTSSAPGALTPGGTVTYTVTVTNNGPVAAPNTVVSDAIPAGITAYAWTCATAGGAVCPNASGIGSINETIATFPVGSTVTYTITATVSATPPAVVANTATTTPPGGLCLPGNTPPPCSVTVTNPPVPQVSITKTSSVPGALTPGGTVTYTVTATNSGSVAAPNTIVTDAIPAGITAYAWVCASSGGAVCPNASGSGAINETVATFPAGSSVTYTITATVSATPPATVTNTATTTPPSGGLCLPGNTPPPCGVTVTNPPVPQVSIAKTSSVPGALTPGGTVTYTVTATNSGSVAAPNTVVADAIPAGITAYTWTCATTGGAVCPNASGSGAINETIATFPAGSTVTYTITATVSANPPAVVANTATTTPPGGLCLPGNTPPPCGVTVTNPPVPQVSIAKTSSVPGALTPGGTVTYTVTATNSGSVAAPNTVVADAIPAGITAYTWTCTTTGGAVCPNASGSGAINETIATFPAGSSVTYTITATVSANPPATVTNTATTTPPGGLCLPGNTPPPCGVTVTNPPSPQVSITKTSSAPGALTPNGTVTYTVTVANSGSVAAPNTVVTDAIPAGITAYAWTCAANGGAVCPNASGSGAINETIATFPAGSSVVYTITATVSANPPAVVANTATTTPPGGLCLPGNTPPPCGVTVTNPPVPQVSIAKTSSVPGALTPGGTVTYTVTASNVGTVAAPGTVITDAIPAGITAYAWTCASSGGAVCPNASGSGAINETIATFPAGSSVTYIITATVSANPPATVTNTATTTPPGGLCLPGNTPPPCGVTVTNPPSPQVSITKTSSAPGALTPGGTVTYTVTVSNVGAVAAPGTVVSDAIPAGITTYTWTCASSGGAVCPNASGSGAINETIATFPAGSSVVYTITATVSANPPAVVANTATTTPPGGLCLPGNTPPPCGVTVTNPPVPQVSIAKTSSAPGALTPSGTVTYTVTASNVGTVAAPGTVVSDAIPAGITAYAWTCATTGGAVCPNASGSGAINETIATFPAGSTVTYTITATVSANPPATVTNTATTRPPGGLCLPGNTPPPCGVTVTNPPTPQVSITKIYSAPGGLIPNGTVTYTVTVTNAGSVAAPNTVVSDPIPTGIAAYAWTCAATGGAVCPNASGSGAINETIVTFPVGSSVVYAVMATVDANPPVTVANTATTTPPGGSCLPGNTPPPCSATVSIPLTPAAPPLEAPVNARWMLMLLGGLLLLFATSRVRRSVR